MKRLLAFAAVVLVAIPVAANCTATFTAPAQANSDQTYDVLVSITGGSYNYLVTEEWGGPAYPQSRIDPVARVDSATPGEMHSRLHRTTDDLTVTYRVTAWGVNNPNDVCTASSNVVVKGDPELRRLAALRIIPVVGSTDGANGSKFRTELKLVGGPGDTVHLIFHPIGQPANASDPSIDVTLDSTGRLILDDLMAQFGITGVGSLDVTGIGVAEARIYNVTPVGTYGTIEPMLSPADWLALTPDSAYPIGLVVPPLSNGFRLNVGVRALTDMVMRATVTHADGTREMSSFISVSAGELLMSPPEALFGIAVRPGDRVSILIDRGYGIPFYTVTDNSTNDPAIAIPPNRSASASYAN